MVKQTTLSPSPSPSSSAADSTSRDRSCCQFKGVRKRKWGKWVSEIRLPNSRERIWLGSYDSPRKAARAFDAALFCLRGGSAAFNFPHSPPDIIGGRSLNHSQIRVAAAKFANGAAEPPPPATPSVSEGTTELMEVSSEGAASEVGSSASLFDLTTVAAAASVLDFGNVYSGFDDLSGSFYNDYYTVPQTAADSLEENWEGELESFLWNF